MNGMEQGRHKKPRLQLAIPPNALQLSSSSEDSAASQLPPQQRTAAEDAALFDEWLVPASATPRSESHPNPTVAEDDMAFEARLAGGPFNKEFREAKRTLASLPSTRGRAYDDALANLRAASDFERILMPDVPDHERDPLKQKVTLKETLCIDPRILMQPHPLCHLVAVAGHRKLKLGGDDALKRKTLS